MRIAICPGSFDPITKGHLDIIIRASQMVDRLIVAIGKNTTKNHLFTSEERCLLAHEALRDYPTIEVRILEGLLVDFCREHSAQTIVKGLRFSSDFDYELQMAQLNYDLSAIETILLPAHREFGTISSSMLREVALNGGDISRFVTDKVDKAIKERIAQMRLQG